MADFMLAPGTYGVFVHHKVGGGPAYTNGNGSNQQYVDAAMTIDLGKSISGLFTGSIFNPRVWNGTFCYGGGGGLSTYCTAKVNSLGCTPAIAGVGSPSVSATSGFKVECSQVRNNKSGLLFYKVAGTQASMAFQCGTLCVGPSGIKRTPAQSAGGNPPPANDCSGVYGLDMNAFAAGMAGGNPDPALLTSGNLVHCQWWGRDQGLRRALQHDALRRRRVHDAPVTPSRPTSRRGALEPPFGGASRRFGTDSMIARERMERAGASARPSLE